MRKVYLLFTCLVCSFSLVAQTGKWAFINGDKSINNAGIYRTKGLPNINNKPGARYSSASWTDGGSFWLFGGYGYDSSASGILNDLWKYNAAKSEWTWVSGDFSGNRPGIYGIRGKASTNNRPGARYSAASWTDFDGNLWLFGGRGNDGDVLGYLNDLWKFNPTTSEWTWVSGDNFRNQPGIYGTKGVPGERFKPGARFGSVSWRDAAGNLWLFGGFGYDSEASGYLNDLWKFNIKTNEWTWVSGDRKINQSAVYGTKGFSSSTNKPSSRHSAVGWTDNLNNIWLFGGAGYYNSTSTNNEYASNDLWKYSITNNEWTWVSGDSVYNVPGIYRSKGIPASKDKPGARFSSVSWQDESSAFWLFGGLVISSKSANYNVYHFNDLWRYDPSKDVWTWMKGDSIVNKTGIYGTKGIADDINNPGARSSSVGWKDDDDNLWLFSGNGYAEKSNMGSLNDIWKFNRLTLACGSSVSVSTDTISCFRTVTGIDPLVATKDDLKYIKYTLTGSTTGTGVGTASGVTFNKGETTVTYRLAKDTSESCSLKVSVKDTSPPTPRVKLLPDIMGECSVTVTSKPIASDNCAGIITGTTQDPLTYTKQGSYIITWMYSDGNGNTAVQKQNVIVKDTTAPVPTVRSLPDITGECSVTVVDKPTARDNCAGIITGTTKDPITYAKQGSYVITWTYDDSNGNTLIQKQNVIVKDTTAPVPIVRSLPDMTGECSVTVINQPIARDNCAGIITGTTQEPLTYTKQGSYVIIWTYSDGNGNTSVQKQNVIVKDTTAPVPTVRSLPDITGECSVTVVNKPTARDNCAGIVTGTTKDPLVYTKQGSYVITWTYSDGNGNNTVQKQNVTVKAGSGIVPTMQTLPDIVGECAVTITTRPTASDNCAGIITGTTKDPLVYTKQGSYVITWTYSDGNGNTAVQKQNLIVKDTTAPVPTVRSLPDITGECSVTVVNKPTARDNCAGIITGTTKDPLAYTKQGSYVITWTYSDGNGNNTSQKQNVIVKAGSGIIPTMQTLPDIVGECSVTITTRPTASDNCAGIITGTTKDPLVYTKQGSYVITWTYTDGTGNTAVQKQNIIVKDTTAPVPTVSVLPDITGECSVAIVNKPTARDNCAGLITATTNNPLTYSKLGSYVITWTYDDGNGNSTIQKQNVIVKDTTAPVPTVRSLLDITGECSITVVNQPTARDDCTGIITGTTKDPLVYTKQGSYVITWTYSDGNGNNTIQKQNVIVKDTTAPVPTVRSLPDITGECSVTVIDQPTARDNCAGIITGTTKDPLAYTKQGSYVITWTYDDGHGNTTVQKQNIIVKDTTAPVPTVRSLPDITGECSVTVVDQPTARDNCAGTITGTTKDPLVYTKQGSYIITWTYDDGNGNTLIQKQSVIVKAGSGIIPTMQTLPDIVGECSVTVTSKPTASDNCAGIITGTTKDSTTYTKQGSYIIIWTYTDGNGNTTIQKQNVIVKDTTAPVPTVSVLPDVTGECSVTIVNKPTARDNCAGIITGTTKDLLTYTKQGSYTITWTFEDGNGNTTLQKQSVIVKAGSGIIPTIRTLPDIVGECSVTVTSKPTASDNCAGIITGSTKDPITYTKQGSYVITWTYTDGTGNTAVQKQNVIVKDTTAPVPTVRSLPDMTGECSVTVINQPTARDNCTGLITATTNNPLTYTKQGSYIITWIYEDGNGNTTLQKQNVIVKAGIGIIPTMQTLPDIVGECSVTVTTKPTARDNCAGIITGTTKDPITYTKQGSYIITWTYTDGTGNTAVQKQSVIVKDTTAPVSIVLSLPDITGECSVTVVDKPSARDNCAGLITPNTNNPLTYSKQGNYVITWTFEDGNGNTTVQKQNVIVKAGSGIIPTMQTLPDIVGECAVTVTTRPTASDNCAGIITGTTKDPTTYTKQGSYVITWTYTDGNGNTAVQKQNVIVKDTIAPVPIVSSLPDVTGDCSVTVVNKPTARDNCAGLITATTNNPLTYSKQGNYVITWTFGDGNGNTTVQKQNVIIKANGRIIPTATVLPEIVGECSATVLNTPTAKDICGRVVLGTTSDPLNYGTNGDYIITWTYSDESGNKLIQKQKVTVKSFTTTIIPSRTNDYLNVTVRSGCSAEKITLRLFDVLGRLLETRQLTPNQTILLHPAYAASPYFAQIIQGNSRQTVKLIKLSK